MRLTLVKWPVFKNRQKTVFQCGKSPLLNFGFKSFNFCSTAFLLHIRRKPDTWFSGNSVIFRSIFVHLMFNYHIQIETNFNFTFWIIIMISIWMFNLCFIWKKFRYKIRWFCHFSEPSVGVNFISLSAGDKMNWRGWRSIYWTWIGYYNWIIMKIDCPCF